MSLTDVCREGAAATSCWVSAPDVRRGVVVGVEQQGRHDRPLAADVRHGERQVVGPAVDEPARERRHVVGLGVQAEGVDRDDRAPQLRHDPAGVDVREGERAPGGRPVDREVRLAVGPLAAEPGRRVLRRDVVGHVVEPLLVTGVAFERDFEVGARDVARQVLRGEVDGGRGRGRVGVPEPGDVVGGVGRRVLPVRAVVGERHGLGVDAGVDRRVVVLDAAVERLRGAQQRGIRREVLVEVVGDRPGALAAGLLGGPPPDLGAADPQVADPVVLPAADRHGLVHDDLRPRAGAGLRRGERAFVELRGAVGGVGTEGIRQRDGAVRGVRPGDRGRRRHGIVGAALHNGPGEGARPRRPPRRAPTSSTTDRTIVKIRTRTPPSGRHTAAQPSAVIVRRTAGKRERLGTGIGRNRT